MCRARSKSLFLCRCYWASGDDIAFDRRIINREMAPSAPRCLRAFGIDTADMLEGGPVAQPAGDGPSLATWTSRVRLTKAGKDVGRKGPLRQCSGAANAVVGHGPV